VQPTRNGVDFPAFLKAAVERHRGRDVRVVLDDLSTRHIRTVHQLTELGPLIRRQLHPLSQQPLVKLK
jgi:hypothetical protein